VSTVQSLQAILTTLVECMDGIWQHESQVVGLLTTRTTWAETCRSSCQFARRRSKQTVPCVHYRTRLRENKRCPPEFLVWGAIPNVVDMDMLLT
jgi:hypothetical protein